MSKFFINRPIVAMVIAILMVISGRGHHHNPPVAQFPNIVPPRFSCRPPLSARTADPGAIRATPIEQQINGVTT